MSHKHQIKKIKKDSGQRIFDSIQKCRHFLSIRVSYLFQFLRPRCSESVETVRKICYILGKPRQSLFLVIK
jgi:hypothetical protein